MCDVLQKYFDEINWKSDRNVETLIESHKSRGELIKSLNMELDTKKDEFLPKCVKSPAVQGGDE